MWWTRWHCSSVAAQPYPPCGACNFTDGQPLIEQGDHQGWWGQLGPYPVGLSLTDVWWLTPQLGPTRGPQYSPHCRLWHYKLHYKCTCVCVCACVCVYVCVRVLMCVHVCVYMWMYVYMCLSVFACMLVGASACLHVCVLNSCLYNIIMVNVEVCNT